MMAPSIPLIARHEPAPLCSLKRNGSLRNVVAATSMWTRISMRLPSPTDCRPLLFSLLLTCALPSPHAGAEDLRFQLGNHWVQMITPKNWVDANKDVTWYSGNTL